MTPRTTPRPLVALLSLSTALGAGCAGESGVADASTDTAGSSTDPSSTSSGSSTSTGTGTGTGSSSATGTDTAGTATSTSTSTATSSGTSTSGTTTAGTGTGTGTDSTATSSSTASATGTGTSSATDSGMATTDAGTATGTAGTTTSTDTATGTGTGTTGGVMCDPGFIVDVGGGCVIAPPPQDGLELWLDSQDSASFKFANLAMNITTWMDIRGVGYPNAAPTGPSAQPKFSAAAKNGKPGVIFDGTDDVLQVTGLSALGGTDYTVLFLLAPQSTTDQRGLFSAWTIGSKQVVSFEQNYSTMRYLQLDAINPNAQDLTVVSDPHFTTHAVTGFRRTQNDGTPGYLAFHSDATGALTKKVTNATVNVPTVGGTPAVLIGRAVSSATGTPLEFSRAVIGELLIYDRALTDAELDDAALYLKAHWGL